MGIIVGVALAILLALGMFLLGYYLGIHAGLDTIFMALQVAMHDLPQNEQAALAHTVTSIFQGIGRKYSLDELERRTRELDKPK